MSKFINTLIKSWDVVLTVFTLGIVARLYYVFSYIYSQDDISLLSTGLGKAHVLGDGRYFQYYFDKLLQQLSGGQTSILPIMQIVLTISLVFFSLYFCYILKVKSKLISILIANLVCLFPYFTETYYFRISGFYVGLSLVTTAIADLYLSQNKNRLAILLIILSLSINQLSIHFLLCLAFARALTKVISQDNIKYLIRQFIKDISYIIIAVVGYFLIIKLIMYFDGRPPNPRFGLISLNRVNERVHNLINLFIFVMIKGEPFIPTLTKYLTTILLIMATSINIHYLFITRESRKLRILLYVLLNVLMVIASVGLLFVLKFEIWYISPRIIQSVFFIWLPCIALSLNILHNKSVNMIMLSLCTIIVFSYILVNNKLGVDTQRQNLKDVNYINRMLSQIESIRPIPKKIVVVRTDTALFQVNSQYLDFNVPISRIGYSAPKLLQEVDDNYFSSNIDVSFDDTGEYSAKCSSKMSQTGQDYVREGEIVFLCY